MKQKNGDFLDFDTGITPRDLALFSFMKKVNNASQQKKTDINTKRKVIFYVLMVALPILQYLVFYVYVNFNSIIMSLQEYKIVDNKQVYVFNYNDLFANYRKVFDEIFHAQWMIGTIKNSAKLYFISFFCIFLT